jgi:type IV secretory pathway TrbF-like protein
MFNVLVNFEILLVATHPGSRTRNTEKSWVTQERHSLPAIPRPDDILVWKGLQFRVSHAPNIFNLDDYSTTISTTRSITFEEWRSKDKAEALQRFESDVRKLARSDLTPPAAPQRSTFKRR